MGDIFGHILRISTWGESHGASVGVVIDGFPPQVPVSVEDIQRDLERRRPGQSRITTQRREGDEVEVLSGIYEGVTMGTPIALMVRNQDARSKDYSEMKEAYRPSHADYTYDAKFGVRDYRGGGRTSARETVGRVAAGALAKQLLRKHTPIEIIAYVRRIYNLEGSIDPPHVTSEQVEANAVRCPDAGMAQQMYDLIDQTRKDGDSLGGIIECVVKGCPPGVGDPVFDRLEADLAKGMLSMPATKGFEIGSGFSAPSMKGSEHNDTFYVENGKVRTRSNYSGGVQGGISNGEPIIFRVAFKPTATILRPQETITPGKEPTELKPRGRHDPCVLPRAVPIVEAMTALILADHWLLQQVNQTALQGQATSTEAR